MDSEEDPPRTLVIAEWPFDADGWSAELVLLAHGADGSLTLIVRNQGRAVEAVIGEDVAEYRRLWSLAPADVSRLVRAWLRDSCPDSQALARWLDAQGVTYTTSDWHRYHIRPVDEDQVALAVGRCVIGEVADGDEGTTIANRFLTWMIEHQIPYREEEALIR